MSTKITNDAADDFNAETNPQFKLMPVRLIADECRRGARLSAKAARALADGFAECDRQRANLYRACDLTTDDRAALLWLAMQPIRVSNEQERATCVRALECIARMTRGGE